MFVNFLPTYEKRYRCPVPEVRHTFYFLPFLISYLSGNKLGNLPEGIFKGLKELEIL